MRKIEIQLDDVPFESLFRVEGSDPGVVIIRNNNSIMAFEDRCPHAHWPLSEGSVANGIISCIGHGWEFEVASGRCLTVPGCSLKLLPVTVEHRLVKIEVE
jgi:nitrite reductase/ring-hydroxylating ferredoxin subunit